MAMTMHVDIVSAERSLYTGTAEMLFAPAQMGEVGIMPRHAPLLTILKPGEVRIVKQGQEEEHYYVNGGILEVQPHTVTILSDTALRAQDLDEEAALEAKQRAEEIIQNRESGQEVATAQAELAEAMAQLAAISRMRKRMKR